jgi:aminopeptidase N
LSLLACEMQQYRSFYLPESRPHYPRTRDFHTEHIRIELKLDFQAKRIDGRCVLVVSSLRRGVERAVLDAREMEVRNVSVNGKQVEFGYDGERLSVPVRWGEDGRAEISVEYGAAPRQGVYFVGPDEKHPEKEMQAWTQGEAEFSSYWYPCYDYPNDKGTSEMVVTVPKGFVVVSNGRLVSKSDGPEGETFHWREDTPHSTYLNSFVAGKFGVIEEEHEGILLQYYFPESKRADVRRYFGETPRMLDVFAELTGLRYPYSKYSQATVEDFIYGGMENISATTLATTYYPDERSEEDFSVSYSAVGTTATSLVAHELAHQWFGDWVTCSDWPHAWLNEAFATYFQALYYERTRGVDTFRWNMALKAEDFFEEEEKRYRRPIVERNYVYPDDLFDAATYEKGAWMIHQLRYLVGDELFFRGVAEYLKRFARSNADTHDFRKVMESVSGLSLEEFFEQSFHRAGYPEFEVSYSWEEASSTATLRVRQVQMRDGQTPLFSLPCDIVFYTGKGRLKKRVSVSAAEHSFSFELDSRPRIVEFDPEGWILKKLSFPKGLELLVNQLRESVDSSSRALAARELGRLRNAVVIPHLVEAARADSFWHVSATALEAIGEIGGEAALSSLLSVGIPSHRRVRRAYAKALGNFRDGRVYGVLKDLALHDVSPYVQCEAVLSLARARAPDAMAVLKEAMKIHSPNETLQEACLEAMGKLGGEEVWKVVLEYLEYGKPTRARIGALKAIKERGYAREEELAVLKQTLLKDTEFRVRQYLVSEVLPVLADRRMVETLIESSRSDRDPRIRRRALELYHELTGTLEAPATMARLREEVERLREENRLLRSK